MISDPSLHVQVPSGGASGAGQAVPNPVAREITAHQVNPTNDRLKITVIDEPGAGGANHCYEITGFDAGDKDSTPFSRQVINFQNGPIAEAGVNGPTHEVLLAIVADRLHSFQAGPYACLENSNALAAVNFAQQALASRTRARMQRGVEGTHAV